MQTPTTFSISPSSQTGDVYGTEFTFNANLPADYTAFAWSFGDGTFEYNTSTPTHAYKYPGIYTVNLSAWTDYGALLVDSGDVDADYAIRDSISFTKIPTTYGTPGLYSSEPFTVNLISSRINEPLSIVLNAQNTKSVPHYAVPSKWEFITPKWKFIDASTDSVLDGPISLSTVPIYKNGNIIAVSGQASFYYVDDLATGINDSCPLLITATLSTERFSYPKESLIYPYHSYSNSEVTRAVIAWQIADTIPTKLKVTENFLHDVYPIKWTNVPIPVMITCEFDPSLLAEFGNTNAQISTVLSYPRTNEYGQVYDVTLTLLTGVGGIVPSSYYEVEEAPLYFKAFDEYNNSASGYIFTTITPKSAILSDVTIYANTTATNSITIPNSFEFPNGVPVYPNVYISHPYAGVINKLNVVSYSGSSVASNNSCDNILYYKKLGVLVDGSSAVLNVPIISSTDLVNYTLSGAASVYGMAFNPILNRLYTCDVDQNIISTFDSGTTLLTSINLSGMFGTEQLAPSYLSTDAFGNIWVSLFDNQKIIKYDSDLNFLLSAVPSTPIPVDLYETGVGGGKGDYFTAPPIVETDIQNNVWACYSHPISSMLVKFSLSGTEMINVSSFARNNMPVSLAIGTDNNVWVCCYNTNKLLNYSTNGTLIESVSGFNRPTYIALDRFANVWVAHGYNLCSKYNPFLQITETYRVDTANNLLTLTTETSADVKAAFEENEIWGGLATDVYDRVWAIDSNNNVAVVFKANDPTTSSRVVDVFPTANTQYVIKPNDNFVTNIPADKVRSAQAAGDWTGNRWYQKYGNSYGTLAIEGVSTPFKIYDLDTSFKVAKVNEEFDCSAYFKSLALPEILSQNTKLFDEFFAAVVGDGNPTQESAGRVIYERIANFVSNRGDFQTAEIDALLSIAREMAVGAYTFGKDFPVAVNRLLNIFSVPKEQLRGVPNLTTDLEDNIGPILSTTSLITANQYYFVKDKRYDTYQLVYANALSGTIFTYSLDQIEVEGLRQPITDNYHFFEYDEQNSNGYLGNIINWDSDYTTISYNLSTNEEWYGDGGLVETMFNNLLTKQMYEQ